MNQNALVTGANGAIGLALVQHLLARNYKVRALVRDASKLDSLCSRVEVVEGDITDPGVLQRSVAGIGKVFHLAAKLHINSPSPELEDEYRRVNVEGTRLLSEAARLAGVERLVFFSTINVYGASRPREILDEDSPLQPDSFYAETKVAGEQIVLHSTPAVVLRLAAVYGPGMKGNYSRLINALQHRRFAMIGNGSNRRTIVYIEDVCNAARVAAEHPAAVAQTYNVTDGDVHTIREIVEAISVAMGKRPPRVRLPARPVRLAAGCVEAGLGLLGRRSPVGRALVDKFVEDVAVSGNKIQEQLGYLPHYDLRSGWAKTVSTMQP